MKKMKFLLLGCVFLMMLSACGGKKNSVPKKGSELQWVTTWSQSLKGIGLFPVNDNGHTVEYQVPVKNEGEAIKVTLGNYYSEEALEIERVSVSKKQNGKFQAVKVDGKESFTIKAKGLAKTDPLTLDVKEGDSLFVRIYYPDQGENNRAVSGNTFAKSAVRSEVGNYTTEGAINADDNFVDTFTNDPYAMKYADAMKEYKLRFTLTLEGLDVQTKQAGGTIVAFGDSITEQNHWVAPLQNEVKEKLGGGYSVVNAGISGNRLLKEMVKLPRRAQYFGLSGVDRFEHDVYSVNENVEAMIISLGVNDIHQPGTGDQFSIDELPTFDEMKKGYEQVITQAKKHKSKVFVATITPFIGYTVDVKNDEKEALRQKINTWIRKNETIDGVYDFDKVLTDPNEPSKLNSEYDSGDKLHPSKEGGAAMAKEISVNKLKK